MQCLESYRNLITLCTLLNQQTHTKCNENTSGTNTTQIIIIITNVMIIIIMFIILWKMKNRKRMKTTKKYSKSRRYGRQPSLKRNDDIIAEDPMIKIMTEILKDVDLPTVHTPQWEDNDEFGKPWEPWCPDTRVVPVQPDGQASNGLLEIEMEDINGDNDDHPYPDLCYTNPSKIEWEW